MPNDVKAFWRPSKDEGQVLRVADQGYPLAAKFTDDV